MRMRFLFPAVILLFQACNGEEKKHEVILESNEATVVNIDTTCTLDTVPEVTTIPKTNSFFDQISADIIVCIQRLDAQLLEFGDTVYQKHYFTDILALNEYAENGDEIILREGVYELTRSIELWEKNDIVLRGEGLVKLICNDINDNVFWIVTCKRVRLENLHCTHTNPPEGAFCTGNVIAIDMCEDITIKDCDINGCGAIGVYNFGGRKITLKNNVIHDNTFWAIEDDGVGYIDAKKYREDLDNPGNFIFQSNKFFDNGLNNPNRDKEIIIDECP